MSEVQSEHSTELFARQAKTLLRHSDSHDDDLRDWIAQFQIIRAHVAALSVVEDIRKGDDWVMPVVELFGDNHLLDNIQALDERLRAAGMETTIQNPIRDDPNHTEHLSDAAVSLGVAWGSAGYLIGLAVGMNLGPHAFDGVTTPKGVR